MLFKYTACVIDLAGLAVDWINDLVYWVERSPRLIRVYNMNTKVISSVLVMDEPSSSKKLKILPLLGYVN